LGGASSWDPNDKATIGHGAEGWITDDTRILFTIRFENQITATAAAQSVVITDQLDANLDWSTFHLDEVGFNNTLGFMVPDEPSVIQNYSTQVTVSTDPNPVRVSAALDSATGLVTWEMQSVDPVTGDWPEDPLAGFLPPNDDQQSGEGYIIFSIRPQAGLDNGVIIKNKASIVFDVNEPIITNDVINTIDSLAPSSSVDSLPASSPPAFTVSWSGDDSGGSGIGWYDVYVSTDGGPFVAWQSGITATQAIFTGTAGSTYAFYSVATDNVGRREAAPAVADAVTMVADTYKIYLPIVLR